MVPFPPVLILRPACFYPKILVLTVSHPPPKRRRPSSGMLSDDPAQSPFADYGLLARPSPCPLPVFFKGFPLGWYVGLLADWNFTVRWNARRRHSMRQ